MNNAISVSATVPTYGSLTCVGVSYPQLPVENLVPVGPPVRTKTGGTQTHLSTERCRSLDAASHVPTNEHERAPQIAGQPA